MRLLSAKTESQLATRQRCGLFHHHALLSSLCQLHNSPRISAGGHHRKASLILSMRLVRVVTSVPVCATTPTAREHFAPLRQLLTFTGHAAGSQQASTAGLVTGFGEGEPGEVPSLLNRRVQLAASTILQALQALNGTTAFSTAPGHGAGTGLSSQPGSKLTRRYPWSLSRSAGWSGALASSNRGTPHGVRFRSHPVEHTSCNSLHAVEGTRTPCSCCQELRGIYYPGPFRVRTSYHQARHLAGHGIKQRGYSGVSRD